MKNINYLSLTLLLAGFSLIADAVQSRPAQNAQKPTTGKVLYVDCTQAIRQSKEGEDLSKIVQKKREESGKRLQEQQEIFMSAVEQYKQKAEALTPKSREVEEKKLMQMKAELEADMQMCEQEIQRIVQSAMAELDSVVAQLAKELKVEAVVDSSTGRVLYAQDNLDITPLLVKRLDKNHEKKLAQANQNLDPVQKAASKLA